MITTKMPKIIQATLDCYSGSCQNCHPPTWNCLSWRQAKQLVEKVTLYAGDIRMITTKMPKIIQATLDCYSGSCQNCHPPTWNCLSWRQAKQLVEKVTLYAGDIRMITTKMPKIIQATLDCYSGSCQNCHPPTWNCLSWRQAKQLVEKVTAFEGMWPDTTQYDRWRPSNT